MNSPATSVTRLRVHISPVVGWFVLWRKNYYRAILDFYNNIGTKATFGETCCAFAANSEETAKPERRRGQSGNPRGRPKDVLARSLASSVMPSCTARHRACERLQSNSFRPPD